MRRIPGRAGTGQGRIDDQIGDTQAQRGLLRHGIREAGGCSSPDTEPATVQDHGVKMPNISLQWFTWPIGLTVLAFCFWWDWKERKKITAKAIMETASAAKPPSRSKTLKPSNGLGVKVIPTKTEVRSTVTYGCDIEVTNLDKIEAANGVNVQITTFTPGPKNFYTPDISNPSPAELPIRLELNGRSANIGPGSGLRLELFALIRAGPVATIAITGNGKKHRWFYAEIKSRAGSSGPIISYEPYQFTLEVSAENLRKATWRIDLNVVNDSNGIPKVEVEKVEEICI
jgi:hypothetical protein